LEFNRNLANAHSFIGYGKIPIGRAEETKDHSARPYASARAIWRLTLGWISRASRSSISAVTSKRSRGSYRNYSLSFLHLAAVLAQLGRCDEAPTTARAVRALNPAYTVSRRRASWTAQSDDPTYFAQLEPIFEGMRRAGIPEG
jgi:hypothetical protein